MTKPELKILELIFAAEIGDALPWQPGGMRRWSAGEATGRLKTVRKLIEQGLVEEMVAQVRTSIGVMNIPWFRLTDAGHLAFCEWCSRRD